MQLLFRLTEGNGSPLEGSWMRSSLRGVILTVKSVASVRQHTLKPRTPPPLRGTSPHRGGIWML